MASKSVAKIKVDWSRALAQLSKEELPKLNRLKSQIDSTATKVSSLPDSLPKIDWSFYKANASDPKLVEEIEKKYSRIQVEAPRAPASRIAELERSQKQIEERYQRFLAFAESYIESAEVVKKKFTNMIPVKDMTLEDWTLTFPQWSATIENPSVCPHYGRTPGLTREEAMAFDQPDPIPYATKKAWQDWEERKKKFYN